MAMRKAPTIICFISRRLLVLEFLLRAIGHVGEDASKAIVATL
jgi:hypothetical protein